MGRDTLAAALSGAVAGVPMAELGARIGRHRTCVWRWLTGTSRPSVADVGALLDAVDAPPATRSAVLSAFIGDAGCVVAGSIAAPPAAQDRVATDGTP